MDTFIEIFQGLPVVLSISLLFGLVALYRLYIMTNSGICRTSNHDRRQSILNPSFPFRDTKNNLIAANRRRQNNRRLASNVIQDYKVIQY
ncbi:MAG: hypothetical protein ACC653_06845 [Gammaproteobacteria bacterium]